MKIIFSAMIKNYILSHIAAAGLNNVIGRQGKLPWSLPEDLKFFQDKTINCSIIMGRKTFESLGRPLPKRVNIVVSRNKTFKAAGAYLAPNLDEAVKLAKQKFPKSSKQSSPAKQEIFIIGGGEIYKQSLPLVQKIYLTRVHKNFEGDAFYPELPPSKFQLQAKDDRPGPLPFSFLTYKAIQ